MALGTKTRITMTLSLLLLLQAYLVLQKVPATDGIPVEEDLTLTLEERVALDKFKPSVMRYLPHEYMKTDIYLIRWLRARNLNIEQAEQMLRDNLQWRYENKMDTINDEDWTDMTEEYGFNYTLNTVDRAGRPIGAANPGSWNIRRSILMGQAQRGIRFAYKCMEEATQAVIKLQQQGQNVTQWKALFNIEGFNFIDHACPMCLPTYMAFVAGHEEYYPGFADAIILINTPPTFQVLLNPLLSLVGERTRKAVKIFGQNKAEWEKYLDDEISRDQRTPEFGGTKKD